ncbi:hypothetical protein PV04_02929 [Phialophora macrospora]|uniref:Nephrocystin 3-like N-terminal domain-containing protein n=1 Tax=Phialophora macrospora TaxID=1851006 RepID=A0A0D2GET3_9EURO|nr:hypothetical protein PV04_02929 [Phialophora macrospora]
MAQITPPAAIDYHIAVICALEEEAEAVRAVFDHRWDHQPDGDNIVKHHSDKNQYNTGVILKHNVVLASPDEYGKGNATRVMSHLRSTFPGILWGLVVGVCGGVPAPKDREPIYLGDVVISTKILEYDKGKQYPYAFKPNETFDQKPGTALATYLKMIKGKTNLAKVNDDMKRYLEERSGGEVTYPGPSSDKLLPSKYLHKHHNDECEACKTCFDSSGEPCAESEKSTCDELGCTSVLARNLEIPRSPHIHFGYVASGDMVLKSGTHRERYADKAQVIAFEMEGAGVAKDIVDCLVIKGVCDYADSHKHKGWQPYAAEVAAACMKALLAQLRRSKSVVDRGVMGYGIDECTSSDLFSTSFTSRSARRYPKQRQYREALMNSLEFDHIEDRYNDIRDPHYETCKWLFTNRIYQSWLNQDRILDHHGILWLKGKPGTGKSTLIKFAHSKARETRREDIHISFFFNARGSALEKDTLGMYRSLLFQLLTIVPTSQEIFDDYTNVELPRPPRYSWTIQLLKDVLSHAIQELGMRRLWIFVDALDECDEDQIRDMVIFFEHLGRQAATLDINVRVFFASRHYPKITIAHKVELILEDEEEHSRDIERYIQTALKIGCTTRSEAIERIRDEVKRRASGTFIWVVLVVQILNKAYDHGHMATLEKKLREIPTDLSQLFKEILIRDDQNMEYVRLCISWILFAKRPLTREELYFAILSGAEHKQVSSWDAEETTPEVMDAFILSSSKGLAETTRSAQPTVQFIHETIRDFLLVEGGMVYIQEKSSQHLEGSGHDTLKQCCANYLSLAQELVLKDRSSSQEVLLRELPFAHYALWQILFHANAAESNGVSQPSFLHDFNVRRWIELSRVVLSGVWKGRGRGQPVPKPFFALDSSLLYVLAELDLGSLIQVILRTNRQISIEGSHNLSPLFTALENWSYEALGALLTSDRSDELAPCSALSIRPPTPVELDGLATTYHHGYELSGSPSSALQFFCQWGTESNFLVLLRSGRFDLNAAISTELPCSPLSFATARGYETTAQFLLGRQDVDPDSKDEQGLTPLCKAARDGRFKIASLLLQGARGVNVNSRSHVGRSPLSYAAENGHEAIFNLLLAHPDVVVNLRDNEGRTPLFHAAARGREAILTLLKENPDVDFISRDNINHTALSYAVLCGHENVVGQLLESRKIDVNSKDSLHGRTALSFAFQYGYQSIAKLLLDIPGIDISIRDHNGRTLLDYAQLYGHEGMAILLPSIR